MLETATRDNLNVETVTNAAGRLVTYAYDPVGRRTGMTGSGGKKGASRFLATQDSHAPVARISNVPFSPSSCILVLRISGTPLGRLTTQQIETLAKQNSGRVFGIGR